jgi:teichuronic acid biosynthesis protein TuaE
MFSVSIVIGITEAITAVQLPVKHYYNFTVSKLSAGQIEFLKSRPIAFFYNSNNFATFISICIPFLFFLFFYVKNRRNKILIYILTDLAMAVLFLTTSRSVMMLILLHRFLISV